MKKNGLILFVLTLFLSACASYYTPSTYNTNTTKIDAPNIVDSTIIQLISPYKSSLQDTMNHSLVLVQKKLKKDKPESDLGNFLADAVMYKVNEYRTAIYPGTIADHTTKLEDTIVDESSISLKDILESFNPKTKELKDISKIPHPGFIDFCTLNYGGIRLPQIDSGTLTLGTIYELLPFENELVILELSGADVKQLLDKIAESGGWPISSEVRFQIKNKKAENILIHNTPLNMKGIYNVVTVDYVANGGDDCDFLKNKTQIKSRQLLRDIIVSYCETMHKKGISIQAEKDGRITYAH